ncbi:MAG TPA: hypothetical protein VK772_15785 [Puia sp.]|jgi:hypothetical protein|nr:hypothetical protein [Puia sp.]
MKFRTTAAFLIFVLVSCNSGQTAEKPAAPANPLIGTWKLISGTTIQGKDTITTDYTKDKYNLKIINETHFAFVGHDLTKGKDSMAFYSSGAGPYTLKDSVYTESLQFCNERAWEGHDFTFTVTVQNDSLTQIGIEKIDSLKINRLNIERYVRVK